ncbi:SOS-response transcriptional repressor LexA [Neorhizobium galegae]|uniref:LexA family protein n=1 Tax=Neorhizobium galegae TaxID=399 RepID=UPI001EC7832F|nr:S24 family peptidase [Neorhizobium galegae]MBP2560822.1 SOS-response transcriptional repressor LexA [Neorhizobium galegae]
MADTMRDIYRTCQRHMSRSQVREFAVIIPHMKNMLKSQILGRVEERLKKLGMSERRAGVLAAEQPDLLRGWRVKDALPRIDSLIQIAPVLETTPEYLAFGIENDARQSVPKISWVNAGAFGTAEAVVDISDAPRIEVAGLGDGEFYALDVQGDSMDRISPDGSTIVVNRKDTRLVQNACYIVLDGEGGATYKRYRQSPTRFEPVSTNASHEPIFPDNDNIPAIFGRVVLSILKM